jgi:hypothetical protein
VRARAQANKQANTAAYLHAKYKNSGERKPNQPPTNQETLQLSDFYNP